MKCLECRHLQNIRMSTWNMTWGENTKSSRRKIDTVRCVGPADTRLLVAHLQPQGLFPRSILSFFRRGEVSSLQTWGEEKPSMWKLLNIYIVHWASPPPGCLKKIKQLKNSYSTQLKHCSTQVKGFSDTYRFVVYSTFLWLLATSSKKVKSLSQTGGDLAHVAPISLPKSQL